MVNPYNGILYLCFIKTQYERSQCTEIEKTPKCTAKWRKTSCKTIHLIVYLLWKRGEGSRCYKYICLMSVKKLSKNR